MARQPDSDSGLLSFYVLLGLGFRDSGLLHVSFYILLSSSGVGVAIILHAVGVQEYCIKISRTHALNVLRSAASE